MNEAIFAPTLRGTFFRAVDPEFRQFALSGSRTAGRYSRQDQPTLYLSSSVAGVQAAMSAHKDARSTALETLEIEVEASRLVDLRDQESLARFGVNLADATAPWQDLVASGQTPSSWRVRDKLIAAGADGLIDPSRTKPGLWHLVLFRWNVPGAPSVWVKEA